jgi:hypothetical protein
MQLGCSTVDWSEISKRHAAGTLADDLMEIEGDEEWVCEVEDWYDSAATWSSARQIYEALAPHLSPANRRHGDASLGVCLGKQEFDDLDAKMECYVQVWSPERVQQLSQALEKFDFAELQQAYGEHHTADEEDCIADFDELQEYCEQWQRVLSEAADEGRGILCHCG